MLWMKTSGFIPLMLPRTVSLGFGLSKYMLSSTKVLKLKKSFTTSTSLASMLKSLMQTSSHFFMTVWNLNEGKPNSWAHLLRRHPVLSVSSVGHDLRLGRPMTVIFTSGRAPSLLASKCSKRAHWNPLLFPTIAFMTVIMEKKNATLLKQQATV
ncbi:hypothetical protein U9M48_001251 [Paspalum notatum var. saurae]|uniref:Uncharacterized protein n=1 Tax=Paspalum notatum var. saurae TaxID=547442 RepID=A0AAQ3SF18_PASNO